MTDTEFGNHCQALGVGKGRLEVAVEIIDMLRRHPLVAEHPDARAVANDVVRQCEAIIESVSLLTTPTV